MNISRRTVQIKVPATSGNLGPGFDVLGIALGLYNDLELTLFPIQKGASSMDRVEWNISGEGAKTLPRNEENIIWRAALKVFKLSNLRVENYHFCLRALNRIPLARGLGSSSAAILSGLVAANELTENSLSQEEILNLALEMEGHPDNAVPALLGGLTVADALSGKVQYLRLDPPKDLVAVVCVPEFELSTAKARSVLPKEVLFQDALFNVKRVSRFLGALWCGNYAHLKEAMEDRLHQPYREKLVPGFRKVLERGYLAGALGMALSGAGPSVLALVKKGNSAKVAHAMEKGFSEAKKRSKSLVLNFDRRGLIVK